MFGKDNTIKLISEGNLDRLKKTLEKNPELLSDWFQWKDTRTDRDVFLPFCNTFLCKC